jgi:sec-independent protein translocase protein TatB
VIDLGISKMALIGVVALIVIGPEKLPRVARTVGTLMGKAQRYVADVKAEVNRAMDLEELQKMKASVESAARDVESSVRTGLSEVERQLEGQDGSADANDRGLDTAGAEYGLDPAWSGGSTPRHATPKKNWRLKRGATPQWYKAKARVRTHVQSGAARVARFRPRQH